MEWLLSCVPEAVIVDWVWMGEGYDMAPWFCGQGITYMVLKYRMPNGHWEVPVSDAEQAIRMVRQHAKEWNVNPYKVGLMGASAGGHLTATLATHYNSETRPDFQILLYPVVTMMQVTRGNTRAALLGKNPTMEQIQKFSAELQVTPDTPLTSIYRSYLRRPFRSTLPRSELLPCFLQKTRFRQLSMFILPEDMAGDFRIIFKYKQTMDTGIGEMVARRRCIPGKPRTHVTNREILPGN